MQSQSKPTTCQLTPGQWLAFFLASGFFSGLIPIASGTFATLAYLPIFLLLHQLGLNSLTELVAVFIFTAICAIPICRISLNEKIQTRFSKNKLLSKKSNHNDPSYIVLDEWLGMQVALFSCADFNLMKLFLAFLLFRFFDILKPWPVSALEKLPNEIGVIADDIAAGFLAFVIMYLIF